MSARCRSGFRPTGKPCLPHERSHRCTQRDETQRRPGARGKEAGSRARDRQDADKTQTRRSLWLDGGLSKPGSNPKPHDTLPRRGHAEHASRLRRYARFTAFVTVSCEGVFEHSLSESFCRASPAPCTIDVLPRLLAMPATRHNRSNPRSPLRAKRRSSPESAPSISLTLPRSVTALCA